MRLKQILESQYKDATTGQNRYQMDSQYPLTDFNDTLHYDESDPPRNKKELDGQARLTKLYDRIKSKNKSKSRK